MVTLSPLDLQQHERLGITADVLERYQVRRVSDDEARDVLGLNGRPGSMAGVVYPYFVPGTPHAVTHRLRRDHPETEGGRPKNKYLSAIGDRKHLYFGVTEAALLADVTIPVVPVEAEKSVLAVLALSRRTGRPLLPIGLGGCWGWRGRVGKIEDANGVRVDEVGPLPDLDRVTWTGRDVVIALDANVSENTSVQAARRALAFELTRRGARVRVLTLPIEDGINGPDDFIGRHGDVEFLALLDAAADAAGIDHILRLNLKHAVVPEGGKTVVLTDDFDPGLKRRVLRRSSFGDFRNLYLNEQVPTGIHPRTGEPKWEPLGHAWLKSRDCRKYAGVVMSPGRDVPGYWNLWRGFAVTPQRGDWSRLADHIYEVVCCRNDEVYAYVLGWQARAVQHPDQPAEVALALRGPRGAGKGMFVSAFGQLFGQHYLQIANSQHITGHFNSHLQDCIVLFADEAFWAGDKAGESVLKMLVTEPTIPIERKGHDVVAVPNFLHIILASNHDWVVPAGMDERRFCVMDVSAEHQQDHDYFGKLQAELDAGGRAALLHDLLEYDLSAFNHRNVPQTDALREQKVLSFAPVERWLFDKLMAGQWLPDHTDGWRTFVVCDELHADYCDRLQRVGVPRRSTETELGMSLRRLLPRVDRTRRTVSGKRAGVWLVPDLQTCRTAFDAATNARHDWPEGD